jgi:cytidylate kinase
MEIARQVSEGLNLALYDDRKLQDEALRMGIRSEDIKSLDEKAPGFFDRILTKKPQIYLDFMESVVYEVAKKGQGVIIGHGSQMLLRDFGCAFHVRILAPQDARIQQIMDRQGVTRESALKLVHKDDNERRGFFQFAFHMDWNDPSLYDLIINTHKMGIDSAAKLVLEAAQSDEMTACSLTALDAMDRLAMVKKIEAALLKNDIDLTMLHIEVPEKGLAYVRGSSSAQEIKEQIGEIVKGIDGITEVKIDVSVLPPGYI